MVAVLRSKQGECAVASSLAWSQTRLTRLESLALLTWGSLPHFSLFQTLFTQRTKRRHLSTQRP